MEDIEIVKEGGENGKEKVQCPKCGLLFSYKSNRAHARYLHHRGTATCATETKRWGKMKDREFEMLEYNKAQSILSQHGMSKSFHLVQISNYMDLLPR